MLCNKCLAISKGMHGNVCTKYKCNLCDREAHWGNTNHPKLCGHCMQKMCQENKCEWCGDTLSETKITNYEKIKNMTIDQMAEFFTKTSKDDRGNDVYFTLDGEWYLSKTMAIKYNKRMLENEADNV